LAALAKEHAESIFRTLRADFDYVVIDSGPVLGFADAMLLGGYADAAVLSVLRDISRLPKVYEARDRLESVGIPVLGSPGIGIGAILSSVFFAIIFFLIFVGILQLTAKILGGTGNFGTYSYLISTFYAPLTALGAVFSLIPLVGGCLGLFLWIYELVLAYYATRVEHKLDSGKAIIVVLAPVILAALLACCGIFAFAGIVAALFGQS
jgi:hypothetical protein